MLLYTITKYIKYLIQSQNILRVHSPFVYSFYKNVLIKNKTYEDKSILDLKNYYFQNDFKIPTEEYGAGSKTIRKELSSKLLLKNVASKNKYGNVLANLTEFGNCKKILELGTSLGIGTAYLASKKYHSEIISIECNKELAKLTKKTLQKFNFNNIEIIANTFDDSLNELLTKNTKFDLVYIDGNHTKEATLRYFNLLSNHIHNNSIIVFDDIYWSKGMTEAWQEIMKSEKVRLSIDIFKFGIIFFRNENYKKEHFTLWY